LLVLGMRPQNWASLLLLGPDTIAEGPLLHLPPHPQMPCANASIDIDPCKAGNGPRAA
jgi:hypothetical protein